MHALDRRSFLGALAVGSVGASRGSFVVSGPPSSRPADVLVSAVRAGEDVFAWLERVHGGFDLTRYRQLLGAANPFKEGDQAQGLAAADDTSRENARRLLANTRIEALLAHPVFEDDVSRFADAAVDRTVCRAVESWTLGRLVRVLLDRPEASIKRFMPGLPSDIIGCGVKLMSNSDLVAIGRKIFNPLPGSQIGARGYMGARIQPNSPTDHP